MASHFPWLTVIIFLPLLGSLLALYLGRNPALCRLASLVVALVELLVVALLFTVVPASGVGSTGTWLLTEDRPWVSSLGIRYSLGLDGISLMLALLSAFLTVLCILVSWREIRTRVGTFHFFLFLMETSIMGVFLSTDLFLFYLFWEIQVIPMFFLIAIWGHEDRIYATIKFLLFTLAGSLFMLIALIGLYVIHGDQTGQYTFSLGNLMQTSLHGAPEIWLFTAFLLAFAIKIPVFPVHTWLPDAHTQAPTAGSVFLAGLLLKTGAYALLRFAFPLFPVASRYFVPLLLVLGLIGLFYAGWIALAQRDLKRLVAYSSIGHMGLILIGIAAWNAITLSGAALQMINHGLTTSALFILVGMLDERLHTREIASFGGLWKKIPAFSAFFLFFAIASLGLPGLNNFVGELLILVGTVGRNPFVTVSGFAGLVFTVIYILTVVQKTLFEEARNPLFRDQPFPDLSFREALILAPLAAGVLFVGFHPQPVLDLFAGPIAALPGVLK